MKCFSHKEWVLLIYFMHLYIKYSVACLVPSEDRRGLWIPRTGVTGGFEPPLGAGNQTWVP